MILHPSCVHPCCYKEDYEIRRTIRLCVKSERRIKSSSSRSCQVDSYDRSYKKNHFCLTNSKRQVSSSTEATLSTISKPSSKVLCRDEIVTYWCGSFRPDKLIQIARAARTEPTSVSFKKKRCDEGTTHWQWDNDHERLSNEWTLLKRGLRINDTFVCVRTMFVQEIQCLSC